MVVVETLEDGVLLNTPKPGQDVRGENGDSGTRGDAGESLLRARFAVRKLVPADHNCNEAGDFRNRSGKQVLHGRKARVKG